MGKSMEGRIMTRDETKQILMRMQASFPSWKTQIPLDILTDTWHETLNGMSYQQALSVMRAYVLSDKTGFPPTIGQFVDVFQNLFGEETLNPNDAWNLLMKAISNSGYHQIEEFNKLPDEIKEIVGSPSQLKMWSIMYDPDNTSIRFVKNDFIKQYTTLLKQKKEKRVTGIPDLNKNNVKKIETSNENILEYTEHRGISESTMKKIEEVKKRLKGIL